MFLEDYERYNRAGRSDMLRLKALMMMLLYRTTGTPEEIVFERLGTHSELF